MAIAAITIVIPVLRDTISLQALVQRIRNWVLQPVEIIVVSAGANLQVRQLCREHNCHYAESDCCRGTQLDRGAEEATADTVWFLHADAEPHPDSLHEILRAVEQGAEGGYFRFTFLGEPAWWKALLGHLINLRTQAGGIPYGDQGIFVRREAYFEGGGFAHQPLFEEVDLVRELRSRGHFRALALPIGVAARRWERDGWWHRSLANRGLAFRYQLGVPAERLAQHYEGTAETNRKTNP